MAQPVEAGQFRDVRSILLAPGGSLHVEQGCQTDDAQWYPWCNLGHIRTRVLLQDIERLTHEDIDRRV
jgi:hypothetical protein